MCGFFTHGFWWEKGGDYVVVADWEINSHSKIKEYRKDLIPANAQRWGFNPINGEPVTSESDPLPEMVKDKICLLRELYFPNKEAIADWMKKNYGKQGDKEEWDLSLLKMLDDFGVGLFSRKYYEEKIKYWKLTIMYWKQESQYCEQNIKAYKLWIKNYAENIKAYKLWIKNCTGELDQMDIDKFITYFLEHPNKFWADRKEERKINYESFVRV